ncbi:type I methionyl aminopeptidase [Fulvivirgaceae bacterium PWU5]|uniref:Methionine aminopeptidase n=1 Tax=Dawidia cretensis TaxID=2782350 RepID=A0AAP2GWQ5_9BACT|nr:type I methionyl aminopeptidase [Dawidia cretensis]MBT1711147.1 type I methionyl aminopeptidase [Dawidia cretensis]
MSITSQTDLVNIRKASEAVALTLRQMRDYARPGMTTKELDDYGAARLQSYGARSAPYLTYGFPGHTCISVNHDVAHGIPSNKVVLAEGDLVNIDVSAELNGYWADNGGSFVLGRDLHQRSALVDASKKILHKAIHNIRGGVRIADIGRLIETEARKAGYTVLRNLVGHGIGRALHEAPHEIPCYYDRHNHERFRKNSVVAVETFISTRATMAYQKNNDGWTLTTRDKSFVAQHEHTIVITDGAPIILTEANQVWDNL